MCMKKKVYLDLCFIPHTEINSSKIIDLDVKANTLKLQGNLHDLGLSKVISGHGQQ